jgi:hypothetical protein
MGGILINLLQEIIVWKSIDSKSAVKYCCFHNLQDGKYCVQSADFFYLPVDDRQLKQSEMQSLELFIEVSPMNRCKWFTALNDAILAHDVSFKE